MSTDPLFDELPDTSNGGEAPAATGLEATHQLGHRARLRERFLKGGPTALADYELLEMILFAAYPRGDTKPIAKAILAAFGNSFAKMAAASPRELKAIKGVGDSAVAAIKCIETAALKMKRDTVANQPVISSWYAILDYLDASMQHKKEEEFRVLFLDRKNKLLADELQTQGTVDQAHVYPREIIKKALDLGASSMILVHNHPSGDPKPSVQDIDLTKFIVEAARPLGVTIHDHVIIGKDDYASFKNMGLL